MALPRTLLAADSERDGSPLADSSKRAAILKAATDSFLEVGFGAASMDAIAQRAHVSKATVYAHFSSKEELFGTIVAERCRTAFGDEAPLLPDAPDVAGTLAQLGRRFVDLLVSPEGLAFYRLVVAESPRFPEIGRTFYAAGPERLYAQLAQYLEEADRRGWLGVKEPRLAAEQFLGMLKGEAFLKRILGLDAADPAALQHAIDAAVAVILKAYAKPPPA
ncbi:MAG: TetR/AcrR family transcriptional regulator [Proteobacteria bacterium]|nr:TetR/AcrR family transcriptional regulator [Pseudomonadota bacterium]MBI3497484.1 TetR/AcrR family transcriptional regulator [Pseudomonadota bacterium]